jgi:hypothetical protein
MRKPRMAYLTAAAVIGGMVIMCNQNKGPTNPPDNPEPPPGNVILSEGFEGDSTYLDSNNYRQIAYDTAHGRMSISTQHAHSGNGSLTSDSNNTSIKRGIGQSIDDSIAGLQFYLMATAAAHTNFFAALCKPGSSADGLITKYGMGIDKSDSLNYICYDYLGGINEYKNFAPLALNKWYKCKIEYDYTDTTLTFFLDNDTIYTRTTPSTLTPFQTFVAIRDGLGAQGPSGYYIDDVTIYKR